MLEWPGDPPTLVAWPGLGGTAAYFGMLADGVPFRILALDPPGVSLVSTGPWIACGRTRFASRRSTAGGWWP